MYREIERSFKKNGIHIKTFNLDTSPGVFWGLNILMTKLPLESVLTRGRYGVSLTSPCLICLRLMWPRFSMLLLFATWQIILYNF